MGMVSYGQRKGKNQKRSQAGESPKRSARPNGSAQWPQRANAGKQGKRTYIDKANGHIKRTWGMRPGISGHAKRHEDGVGGQGETGNMQERLRG